jgi:hypothetical protein
MQSTIEGVTRRGLPTCHSPAILNPASSATNKREAPGNSRPSVRFVLFEIRALLNAMRLPKHRHCTCCKQPTVSRQLPHCGANGNLSRPPTQMLGSLQIPGSTFGAVQPKCGGEHSGSTSAEDGWRKLVCATVICGTPWLRLRMYQSDLSDVVSSSLC